MKTSYWRPIILSMISLGLIAVFIYYLYSNSGKYLELLQISIPGLFILFFLSLIFPVISGISNVLLFRNIGADISYLDGFFLAAASTLANQLPISGGIVSKGFYLKRKHNLSYAKFFSATIALFVCFIAVDGLVGLVILFYWTIFKGIPISPILLIGFIFMVSCILVFWLPLERINISHKAKKWLNQAIEGWVLISRNSALLLRLVGLQLSTVSLLAARYWLAFNMLSQDVKPGQAVLFSVASILTQLVSIAPGGLGVREAIVGAVASALGFEAGTSVVAVGLDRLISTLGIILVGGVSTIILGKQISDPSTLQENM